jgi:hypothetical protein
MQSTAGFGGSQSGAPNAAPAAAEVAVISGAADEIVSRLVAVLDERGATQKAENAGLERRTIIKLAQRLNPDELLDFDQAVIELESAVNVALDVIAQGERGTNLDAFIDAVLTHVAEKTRAGDFDGGASTIDQSLAELDAKYRRSRVALLEEGVKVDILRRDAFAVAAKDRDARGR